MIRILFLGDIVGEPGRKAVIRMLPVFQKEQGVDFVIVNGENAAAGRGITGKIAIDLLRAGVAVITTGDHVWDQKDLARFIDSERACPLRPLNAIPKRPTATAAWCLDTSKGKSRRTESQGPHVLSNPTLDNPFHAAEAEGRAAARGNREVIIVDMRCSGTTSRGDLCHGTSSYGKVSAVFGTHTHVQTADEQIFPGGTGFLCDAGMCGPARSCLGREVEPIIKRFMDNMPGQFPVAKWPVRLCGVMVDVDETTGRTTKIQRVSELVKEFTSFSEDVDDHGLKVP